MCEEIYDLFRIKVLYDGRPAEENLSRITIIARKIYENKKLNRKIDDWTRIARDEFETAAEKSFW